MEEKRLLGIRIKASSKKNTLEHIEKYISNPRGSIQIVSVNPENLIIAQENKLFKKIIETSQIQIIDGAGAVAAGRVLGIKVGERLTGVELMEEMIKLADRLSLRVLLIGGRPNLALKLADCYGQTYNKAKFLGLAGIENIKKPLKSEENSLFSIVTDFKPHILFASFGSPDQELWLDRHRRQLRGIVCMGVGGAFDFLGGNVARAPKFIRQIGLEWCFRLFVEPWRWKRQLRLIKFCWLILKQKLNLTN